MPYMATKAPFEARIISPQVPACTHYIALHYTTVHTVQHGLKI